MSTPSSSVAGVTPRRSSLIGGGASTPASASSATATTTPGGPPTKRGSSSNANPGSRKGTANNNKTTSTTPTNPNNTILPHQGAIPAFTFPPPPSATNNTSSSEPSQQQQSQQLSTILLPLSDERSPYPTVAKACLHLTQWFGMSHSSASSTHDTSNAIASSSLLHETTIVEQTLQCVQALTTCARQHLDRLCRKISLQTLGILTRNMYGRIRPSLLLYNTKPLTTHSRLEEELSLDVPSTMISIALNDGDDGVSSSAVESLGMLVLTTSFTTSTMGEDELLRDGWGILGRVTPYAPTLKAVSEEDPATACLELSWRVLEQAIIPRLVQLLDRISGYERPNVLIIPTIPVVAMAILHAVRTSAPIWHNLERSVYAKRWSEVNALGLMDVLVTQILLPLLEGSSSSSSYASSMTPISSTVAVALIRLAHAGPQQSWLLAACRGAARSLLLSSPWDGLDLETKLAHVAYGIIALRPLPIMEKLPLLQAVTNVILTVPSTVAVPSTVVSPGIVLEIHRPSYVKQIRKPTRPGLWTEIALSLFVDGPPEWESSSSSNTPPSAVTSSPSVAALQQFLTTGAMGKVIAERHANGTTTATNPSNGVLSLYDEILLAFTTVSVEALRRYRVGADGSMWYLSEEASYSPLLWEWTHVAGIVLNVFAPCLHFSNPSTFVNNLNNNATTPTTKSDDDLTLLTAGQASYICLLQEYLFPTGFLNSDSCVSVTLTGNACPPHLLWDQVAASSSFLSKLDAEPNDELEAVTSQLIDELVTREVKQGTASHPLRMYLLTLASDHWIQGRIASVRKHVDTGSTTQYTPVLRGTSGRDIALALSPRRILAKLIESQSSLNGPEDNKKKRDTAKKLAQDTVKTCVACIEGIALMACDWRRRFGASQETKHLVSVAVGLLQGKVDDTPLDDNMKAMLGPICDAAVSRIQAFYESDGGGGDPMELNFPVSDLLAQPVKPKIKPLISSSKVTPVPREKVLRYHLMQLCRQVVKARCDQALYSLPVADSCMSNARTTNYLRLSVPPLPESKDARLLGNFGRPLASWGTAVNLSSASSDAAALIAAYTHRRYVRHDGEEEYRLTVLLRAFNTTPTSFAEGLRLELGVVQKLTDFGESEDPVTLEVANSLGGDIQSLSPDLSLLSSLAVYKEEVKGGDSLTWEVSLDQSSFPCNSVLIPSISFRNVAVEPIEVGSKWVGEKKSSLSGDASTTTGGESKSGEDDFQVTSSDKGKNMKVEDANLELVTLPGEPLLLTPLIGLQPCPMVFYRDRWGDVTTFRIFWFNMAHQVSPLKIQPSAMEHQISPTDKIVAEISRVRWRGEAIPGGAASQLWAFSSLTGSRVYCVLAEADDGKQTLHFRGDDKKLLFALTGSKSAREVVVSTLCPGMWPAQ